MYVVVDDDDDYYEVEPFGYCYYFFLKIIAFCDILNVLKANK